MINFSAIKAPAFRGRRFSRGVTLMELMIVIVILGIVATIAIPSYRKYLIRSQRSEAKIALLQLQTAEEKFYMQNNAFTNNVTAASPTGLGLPATTETGKYSLTVDVVGQTYTATATPVTGGGQADDKDCRNFTITDRGTKGISGSPAPTKTAQECWR